MDFPFLLSESSETDSICSHRTSSIQLCYSPSQFSSQLPGKRHFGKTFQDKLINWEIEYFDTYLPANCFKAKHLQKVYSCNKYVQHIQNI